MNSDTKLGYLPSSTYQKYTFIYTQWWIPFIGKFILSRHSDNHIIIAFSSIERLLLRLITPFFSNIKVCSCSPRKSFEYSVFNSSILLKSIEYLRYTRFFSKTRNIELISGLKKVIDNIPSGHSTYFVCWNSLGLIEKHIVESDHFHNLIFELGYFRPNSLSVSTNFTRNFPSIYHKIATRPLDSYHVELSKLRLLTAQLTEPDAFSSIPNYLRLIYIFASSIYRLLLSLSFTSLRVKYKNKCVFLIFKIYNTSLEFGFKQILVPLLQVYFKKRFIKDTLELKDMNNFSVFFDQVPGDTSIATDVSLGDKINQKFVKHLLYLESAYDINLYKPHPIKYCPIRYLFVLFFTDTLICTASLTSSDLLEKAVSVSTFSSTVGFESLQFKNIDSLYVLGEAFYKALSCTSSNSYKPSHEDRLKFYSSIKKITLFTKYPPLSFRILQYSLSSPFI